MARARVPVEDDRSPGVVVSHFKTVLFTLVGLLGLFALAIILISIFGDTSSRNAEKGLEWSMEMGKLTLVALLGLIGGKAT